jgi:hypothetical protein
MAGRRYYLALFGGRNGALWNNYLLLQIRYLVESPVWLARKSRLADAVKRCKNIWRSFILAPASEQTDNWPGAKRD